MTEYPKASHSTLYNQRQKYLGLQNKQVATVVRKEKNPLWEETESSARLLRVRGHVPMTS